MARYRHKSDEDLAWNRIRRMVTVSVDVEFRNAREIVLNDALWKAWEEYTKALGMGKVPEIESKYTAFAKAVVQDLISQIPETVESNAAALD